MDSTDSRHCSEAWKYFVKKSDQIATCKICNKDYSYRTTVTNLRKHWKNTHGGDKVTDFDDTDASDEWSNNSDDDTAKMIPLKSELDKKSTWQYFDVLDSDKFVARCKICEKDISYDNISDLTEHVKGHDVVVSDDDEEYKFNSLNDHIPKRFTSPVWPYMRILGGKTAECRLCNKKLSYMTSISNLKKHVRRSHPSINMDGDGADVKEKVIISANGQLYEIQTSDGEKDPISTNEVYLDNTEDFVEHSEMIETSPTFRKINKPVKEIDKKPIRREKSEVRYQKYRKNHSSDEDVPFAKRHKNFKTLDIFGQYIISLLRDMPKQVSDQLQNEIIKQIFTAKMALDSSLTVTSNKQPVTTVTINNGTDTNMPEITVNNVDTITTENNT